MTTNTNKVTLADELIKTEKPKPQEIMLGPNQMWFTIRNGKKVRIPATWHGDG